MVFMLQMAMSIKISGQWLMKIVIIMFLNIGDDCQSICNGNILKETKMLCAMVEVSKMMMTT